MIVHVWSTGCRVVGALTLAGFLAAAFTPAPTMAARRLAVPPDVGPAEAIVVLGASANRDGTLSDASLRRTVAGITLYRDGLAPRLVFLGVLGEAEARARLAVSLGVPRDAILTERWQPTTRDEASWTGEVVGKKLGVRRVLLVTDVLHMRRARSLFERAGLAVRPAPTDPWVLSGAVPEKRLLVTRYVAQELVALAYHKLFGYL